MHASTFAMFVHEDMKYGGAPYVVHLAEVVNILLMEFNVESESHLITVGWLHDVVEDTDATITDVRTRFGITVGDTVALITDADLPTRADRKAEFMLRMRGISFASRDVVRIDALTVKMADRIANLRTGLRTENVRKLSMYVTEDATFSTLFTEAFRGSKYGSLAVKLYEAEMEAARALVGS